MSFDWGVGRYEHTAAQLLPAAQLAVDRAEPLAGRRVVDVGCGTGNAALLAAARGAQVVGVDPAPRLLEVARARAAEQEAEATFVPGDAAGLPVADASADVVISVFAVIFAPDPETAAAELVRVLAPDERLVLTAWIPSGAVSQVNRIAQEGLLRATGRPPGPPPFPWHEVESLDALFAPHGLSFDAEEHEIAFTAASPDDYLDLEWNNHPFAVAGRRVLEQHPDIAAAIREEARATLDAGNEDPAAFRVTSRYVLAAGRLATRPESAAAGAPPRSRPARPPPRLPRRTGIASSQAGTAATASRSQSWLYRSWSEETWPLVRSACPFTKRDCAGGLGVIRRCPTLAGSASSPMS